jgi:hypothetical protein
VLALNRDRKGADLPVTALVHHQLQIRPAQADFLEVVLAVPLSIPDGLGLELPARLLHLHRAFHGDFAAFEHRLGVLQVDVPVRTGRLAGPPATAVPPPREQESAASIAALPFTDMSREKDQRYFCEGMAEEIINVLSRLP